jgi:hypothetical protein
MIIQYIEPLSRAIARTRRALFHPLDLRKWFAVGFTAFLAKLADVGFSGGPGGIRKQSKFDVEEVLYFPQRAWEWLGNHPGWAMLIAMAILVAFIFGTCITWLSARGKFMLLDNVVQDRADVVAPWYEYRNEANSFFLFNLLWGFLVSAIGIAYISFCFANLQALYESSANSKALFVPAVLAGLGLLVFSMISFFIYLLFRDFVVPIMYRDRATTWKAAQKFLSLFLSEPFHFIGYGLFLFCLSLLIVAGIILIGCVTCCIAFLILAIPYINAVVLLPISYAMRSFSIEFLEQFGPEYQIFPRPDAASSDTQPVTI